MTLVFTYTRQIPLSGNPPMAQSATLPEQYWLTPHARHLLQRGEPSAVATTVKARRLGCFPRQTLGEPQRQIPTEGLPP
ncbi:hypothetical protein [Brasilonema sennae]|nr:hypothetical protein [Brasilonema sennae]